jgi:hypothetical protein
MHFQQLYFVIPNEASCTEIWFRCYDRTASDNMVSTANTFIVHPLKYDNAVSMTSTSNEPTLQQLTEYATA